MNVHLPRWVLRLEGLVLLVGSLIVYFDQDYGWLLFVLLILGPDLSFLGYLAGPRVGALAYNFAHTTVWPIGLAVAGVLGEVDPLVQLALIWLTHIGVDRFLGYGLKYPTAFKDTHLDRV
jgi:Domain of unknown function (DUF4260)